MRLAPIPMYFLNDIPKHWVEKLAMKDEMLSLTLDLYEQSVSAIK